MPQTPERRGVHRAAGCAVPRSCGPRSTPTSSPGSACRWRGTPTGRARSTTSSGCSPDFTELHGDRRFADDKAIVAGFGFFHGQPVAVVGHQKGRDTKQKIFRNFGYAKPEGYRKALRVMEMAREVPSAGHRVRRYAGGLSRLESEERGVAEAIALNLREMALLDVPIIVIVAARAAVAAHSASPSATAC